MNFFKKTVFWIIVLAAIGGAFIVFTKEEEKAEIKREESIRLFHFEPEDVAGFIITKGDTIIECINGDNGWYIAKPYKAEGDKKAFERFLNVLVKGKFDGILFEDQPGEKLAEFGLDKPYLEVNFRLKNENRPKSIYFGDRGPTHNIAYAITSDDKRTFRIHADIRAEADKDLYALRNKTILEFDPLKARGVAVIRGSKKIVMEQPAEGKWIITEPTEAIVNIPKLMEMLYKVKNSKIKAFIEEDPQDLKKYGLNNPIIKLNIWSGGAEPPQVLLIGGRDKKLRGLYAKRELIANIFLLEEDFTDVFPKEARNITEN